MKKKIFALSIMALLVLAVFAENSSQVTTKKEKIELKRKDRPSAVIYWTKIEIPGLEYMTEFYLEYQEDNTTFDEAECEKIIREFLDEYKRVNVYSKYEVDDIKAASKGKTKTTVSKRVIFRIVRN